MSNQDQDMELIFPEKIYAYYANDDHIICFHLVVKRKTEWDYLGYYDSKVFFQELICFDATDPDLNVEQEWKEGIHTENGFCFFKSIEDVKIFREQSVREKYLLWQSRLFCSAKIIE